MIYTMTLKGFVKSTGLLSSGFRIPIGSCIRKGYSSFSIALFLHGYYAIYKIKQRPL